MRKTIQLKSIKNLLTIFIVTLGACSAPVVEQDVNVATNHFHPKGKGASEHTKKVLREARESLPFDNDRDFEEYSRGFIAAPEYRKIMADAGHVAWDMEKFDFILSQDEYERIT